MTDSISIKAYGAITGTSLETVVNQVQEQINLGVGWEPHGSLALTFLPDGTPVIGQALVRYEES